MRVGTIFDELAILGDRNGFVPPKAEHLLGYEARVANRIRVNEYILHFLSRPR